MTTTSALMMATTASVGRRDLGSSCAEANNWSPSARLGGGRTAPTVPSALMWSVSGGSWLTGRRHWRRRSTVGWARSATISAMPRERKRVIALAGDDVGGHGEEEADDAAEEAAQGGDDEHDEGVDVEAAAHHLGFDEVLQQQVGGEHDERA